MRLSLAGVIVRARGLWRCGEMLLAFFGNAPLLTFYVFVPVRVGRLQHPRLGGRRPPLGLFSSNSQTSWWAVIFVSVAVFTVFHYRPVGRPKARRARPSAAAYEWKCRRHNYARPPRTCLGSSSTIGPRCAFPSAPAGRRFVPLFGAGFLA